MYGYFSKMRSASSAFTLIALLLAVGCIFSVGCSREGDKASAAEVSPLAARLDKLDGEVGIGRQNSTQASSVDQSNTDWLKANVNTPVSAGSRIFVKDKSHAGIAFNGRNYARLNPATSLDVLSLDQRRTQLALRDGSGIFDVGELISGNLFEVATPNGAVTFQEPGLYQVGLDDQGSTLVSVLSGLAQIVGLGGSGQVGPGQLLTFGGPNGSNAYLTQLDPRVCGNITDDYYSYRYPENYDGRYSDYQRYQSDPYYRNTYRRATSYRYVPDDTYVAGLNDLDAYGDWSNLQGYGSSWCPRVGSDWAPYSDGYWYDDQPLGLTWVSNEPWGWTPYHYGRWVNSDQRWYWVPGEVNTRPVYAPALVAFVPFRQNDMIGWVPLGPGDPYAYRYYDDNYQPQYLGSTAGITNVTNIVNYNIPGAVTVVRVREFTDVVRPGRALTVDSRALAQSQPVLDPYAISRIKELAPRIRSHGQRVRVPDTANLALSRTVITSRDPIVADVVGNRARPLNLRSVPEAEGKRKLQMTNKGQADSAIQPGAVPVPADARGAGKRELRQLDEQRRVQERMGRGKAQQAAAQQQQMRQQQMREQPTQQQKLDRRAAPERMPVQRQQQQQQKQMEKAQRRAAPQPRQQQERIQQQAAQQQQRIQQQAAQQQRMQQAQQQHQRMQQQQHQQQRMEQQQRVQPQLRVQQPIQQQQRQEQKMERRAAQPQGPPANTAALQAGKKPDKPTGQGGNKKGKPNE